MSKDLLKKYVSQDTFQNYSEVTLGIPHLIYTYIYIYFFNSSLKVIEL